MKPAEAEETSVLLISLNAAMNAQLLKLQKHCGEEEFAHLRRSFGVAMADLLDILNPIYREHPDLKPVQLGGQYVVPDSVLLEAEARLGRLT